MDRLYLHHAFVSTISCTIGRIIMGLHELFFLFFFCFRCNMAIRKVWSLILHRFCEPTIILSFLSFFSSFPLLFFSSLFFFLFRIFALSRDCTLCRFIERWTNIFCLVVVCDMSVTRRSNSVWTCRRVKVYCVKENLYRAERYRVCKYFETPVRNPASDWSFANRGCEPIFRVKITYVYSCVYENSDFCFRHIFHSSFEDFSFLHHFLFEN